MNERIPARPVALAGLDDRNELGIPFALKVVAPEQCRHLPREQFVPCVLFVLFTLSVGKADLDRRC